MKGGKFFWLAMSLAGCGAAKLLGVVVVFPDEEARSSTRSVEVAVLVPGENSSCPALLQESAQPGDAGYEIEDRLQLDYPSGTGARTLEGIGPGRRLFYARALDQVGSPILHGCTDVEKTGRGAIEVTIELAWRCRPTNGGVETCDAIDNDCNGSIDDGNPVFLCPQVHRAVATACTAGRCQYACESGWYDANRNWSDGCECHPTRDSTEWCDELDNDCDGQADGPECLSCNTNSDCADPGGCLRDTCSDGRCSAGSLPDGTPCIDDGNVCTEDVCTKGLCQHPPADSSRLCDDGKFCTVYDACDGAGHCAGEERTCPEPPACQESFCDIATDACTTRPLADGVPCPDDGVFCNGSEQCVQGTCGHSGDPCPGPDGDGDCAESCHEATRDCSNPDPAGSPCDDSVPCTQDSCDGRGACQGTPDDSACPAGELCRPACSHSTTGCLSAPDEFSLDCTVTDSHSAACTLLLSSLQDEPASCWQCQAHLIEPLLALVDFEDNFNPGACSLDGWDLPAGPCSRRDGSCPLSGIYPCCQHFDCPVQSAPLSGRLALEMPGDICDPNSFRLAKIFDLRAFEKITLCTDLGYLGPLSPMGIAQFSIEPSGEAFFCQRADAGPTIPRDGLGRLCASYSGAAAFTSSTRLSVWLQADIGGWVLDNVSLQAGYVNCTTTTQRAFVEDFHTCPASPPSTWNGWEITGSSITCSEAPSCQDIALRAGVGVGNEREFRLQRSVDASALTHSVWLCWKSAAADPTTAQLRVEVNFGSGWTTIYETSGAVVSAGACARHCVDLTAVSPAAVGNPSLGIAFSGNLSSGAIYLDEITVQGPDSCASAGRLSLGPLVYEGNGVFRLEVRNLSGVALPVRIECALESLALAEDIFTFPAP